MPDIFDTIELHTKKRDVFDQIDIFDTIELPEEVTDIPLADAEPAPAPPTPVNPDEEAAAITALGQQAASLGLEPMSPAAQRQADRVGIEYATREADFLKRFPQHPYSLAKAGKIARAAEQQAQTVPAPRTGFYGAVDQAFESPAYFADRMGANAFPMLGAVGAARLMTVKGLQPLAQGASFADKVKRGLTHAAPVAGMVAGGGLAGLAQEKALSIGETPEETEQRHQRQAALSERPEAKLADLATMGLIARPSISGIERAIAGDAAAQMNIGAGAGLGGALATANAALERRLPTSKELATGFTEGALFSTPTKLGARLMGHGPTEPPKTTAAEARADLQKVMSEEAPAENAMLSVSSNVPIAMSGLDQPIVGERAFVAATQGLDAVRQQPAESGTLEAGYREAGSSPEFVQAVAVKDAAGNVRKGQIHATIEGQGETGSVDGYVTNRGRFVTREEADQLPRKTIPIAEPREATAEEIQDPFRRLPLLEKELQRATGDEVEIVSRQISDTKQEIAQQGYVQRGDLYVKPSLEQIRQRGSTPPDPNRQLGPGAANIEEFGPHRTIAQHNAGVNEARIARGQEPVEATERKADETTWDNAMNRIERQPDLPEVLVNDVLEGKKTSVSDEEQAIIGWRMTDLTNKRDAAAERMLDDSLPPEEQAEQQSLYENYQRELSRAEEANTVGGGNSARALRFRRRQINDDYTLGAMMGRLRAAKGEPLSKEEMKAVQAEHENVKATQEAETNLDEAQSMAAAKEAVRQEAAPTYSERFVKWAESKLAEFDAAADQGHRTLMEMFGRQTNIGAGAPKAIAALYHIIKAKVARGALTLPKLSAELVNTYGPGVEAFIKPAWDKVEKFFSNAPGGPKPVSKKKQAERAAAAAAADGTEAGVAAVAESGAKTLDDFAPYIRRLGREYSRTGMQVEQIEAKLHEVFSPLIEGVTPRELRDTWTNWGKGKAAPTDQPSIWQAQRRTEAQKLSTLENLTKQLAGEMEKVGVPPTGNKRVEMSDRARRLTTNINELKNELGIVDADPAKRLASAHDAMEKRYVNRIRDLRFEIAKGERIVRQKGELLTSPRLEALRTELAEVQKEHFEVFGKREMTPEQKEAAAIRVAERAEANANAELADAQKGIFRRPEAKATPSKEVAAIRARRDAAKAETALLKKLANPPLSDAQKALDRAMVARERWEQVLAGEVAPAKKVPREAMTQLEEDAQLEIAAMRDLASEMRRKPRSSEEEQQLKALEKATAEYERQLRDADFSRKGGPKLGPDTPKVAQARAVRDAAKAARDAAKKATEPPPKTKEEIAIQAAKTRDKRTIADIAERTARGDFGPRPKNPPLDRSKDPEAVRVRAEADAAKVNFSKLVQKYKADQEWKNKTATEKFIHGTKLAWQAIRNLKLSMDLTGTIQAAQAIAAHPIQGAKVFGRGVRVFLDSLFTKQSNYAKRLQSQLEMSPNRELYKEMGLDLRLGEVRDENAASVLERLADLETRWAGIPDVVKGVMNMRGKQLVSGAKQMALVAPKIAGRGLRASNEAFQAIVNGMRAVSADTILKNSFSGTRPTKQQLELLGNHVNASTGSGGLKRQEGLRSLLFAPNWYLSLLKSLSGQPIAKALVKHEGKVAGVITKEYVRSLASMGVLLALRELFSDENKGKSVGEVVQRVTDPKNLLDPRAGSVKLPSGTTIDLTEGRGAWVSLAAQMAAGKRMEDGKISKQRADQALLNFIKGRLSQEIRTGIMAASQQDYFGKNINPQQMAAEIVTPLSWRDVDKILKAEGMSRGSLLQLVNFVFGNVKPPKQK